MRALLFVVATLLALTPTPADAGKRTSTIKPTKQAKRASITVREGRRDEQRSNRAQSFGAPWDGYLRGATRLRLPEGAHIRRPHRAFGTRKTVEYTRRAVTETLELHPRAHVLAIGDLSAQEGGSISDHHSHQSGRDVDLGLFFRKQPAGYPNQFVSANESNLDRSATWTLIAKLAATADKDGGVQQIYLDYNVQRIIYEWALDHGVSRKRLDKVFEYPDGRGSKAGIVRHYRNHENHLHVRFKCAEADVDCW